MQRIDVPLDAPTTRGAVHPWHGGRRRGRRAAPDQPDRRALEAQGWRTLLEYSENHRRGQDGMLLDVEPRWTAEAERPHADESMVVASVTGSSIDEAWSRLRIVAAAALRRPYDGAADV
jgi:hypothetical protein